MARITVYRHDGETVAYYASARRRDALLERGEAVPVRAKRKIVALRLVRLAPHWWTERSGVGWRMSGEALNRASGALRGA